MPPDANFDPQPENTVQWLRRLQLEVSLLERRLKSPAPASSTPQQSQVPIKFCL